MKLNPFRKPKNTQEQNESGEEKLTREGKTLTQEKVVPLPDNTGTIGSYKVLRNFYVSEKASLLGSMNQYVFRVFNDADKREIKKQVEKTFNVKVKSVKILNMPPKRRDIGKHPGFKSGFKKTVVVLEKGYLIEQTKA